MAKKLKIDFDEIRKLAELVQDTELSEIEIEEEDLRIRVSRGGQVIQSVAAPQPQMAAPMAPAAAANANPGSAGTAADGDEYENHPGAVKSPMVGTAYLQAEPGADPFVSSGAKVSAGDTLLIVEAMKVMNEIQSDISGEIIDICAQDGDSVEYGQLLFKIK